MNEKRYQVVWHNELAVPVNFDSNGHEIRHEKFYTEKEAVDFAESIKDNFKYVTVKNTGTNEVIRKYVNGERIDVSDFS